ncbi:MAG TPA: right-handed parallel beta-helix repeat-containing protein [Phycisphaerae bacterium]|nr:right-handed parallel beta-helix repeat-containing protein [Phycisphaerae bacterium]HUT62263.1 right-handed parallel beta-helix repeat-containing protein [Phycisphaerae bacterium]
MTRLMKMHGALGFAILAGVVAFGCGTAGAADYYVSPKGDDAKAGTSAEQAFRTIAKAAGAAKAGDTVNIAPGTYVGRIRPAHSGTAEAPIVFRRQGNGEAVISTSKDTDGGEWYDRFALKIAGQAHIIIDGLTFRDAEAWIYVGERSHHVTIRNCIFERCRIYHGILINNSDYNTVRGCLFKKGMPLDKLSDLLAIWRDSSHNLVEDCEFHSVGHDDVAFQGYGQMRVPSFNIVRRCTFIEPHHRALGIHDSRHTLVEQCEFVGKAGQFIQFQGPLAIIRRNVMRDYGFTKPDSDPWWNAPLLMRSHQNEYGGLAVCQRNRVYNNLFANTNAVLAIRPNLLVADNVFKNNIVCQATNLIYQEKPRFELSRHAPKHQAYTWVGNVFFGIPADRKVVRIYRTGYPAIDANTNWTLAEARAKLAKWYVDCRTADPQFADAGKHDFRLKAGSPCIDKGVPLTTTSAGGRGTVVPVDDPLYFCDGWKRVPGDVVVIGGNKPARIVKVDYRDRALTVDRELVWKKADPVHLAYEGAGPDIGPYESGKVDIQIGRKQRKE